MLVVVRWVFSVVMVGAELEWEDFALIAEVLLIPPTVVTDDGSVVVFITTAATAEVGTKVLLPTIPSHITWHELVLNEVGTLSQSRRSFPKT